MSLAVFGQEWVNAWLPRIRESVEYRSAARKWEWPLMLVMRADPERGVPEDRRVYLDLWHGDCREARLGTPEDKSKAGFVLSADVRSWKEIFDRKLGPIAAIVRGKIKLDKGSLFVLTLYTTAAIALVGTATEVDTAFPDRV